MECPSPAYPPVGEYFSVEVPDSSFADRPVRIVTLAGEVRQVDAYDVGRVRLHLDNKEELARWGGHPASASDTFSVVLQIEAEDEARSDLFPVIRIGDRIVVELHQADFGPSSTGFLVVDSLGVRYAYDHGNALVASSLMPFQVTPIPSGCESEAWEFPYLRVSRGSSDRHVLEGERDTLGHHVVQTIAARRATEGNGCDDCANSHYRYVIKRLEQTSRR